MRLRLLLPCTLSFLGALLAATGASAMGLPLLVVHRTDDTASCPDASALAALVAAQMKHPALEPAASAPGPDRGLDVQIYKSEAGYTAVIQAGGKTRQLADKGATCGGLSAALAISIAVMIDAEPLPPEPGPEPEPPPLPAPLHIPEPPAPESPPPRPPAPLPASPDERPSDVRRFHVTFAAAPIVTAGVLRPFAAGILSEIEIHFRRLSVGVGVFALLGQTFTYRPGQIDLTLTAGLVRGCADILGDGEKLRFALCLAPLAGAARGVGQGFTTNRTSTQAWAAAGASALFQQRIWGLLSWAVRAELLIPIVKDSFLVNSVGTAFAAPPVGGALDAELRVSIW